MNLLGLLGGIILVALIVVGALVIGTWVGDRDKEVERQRSYSDDY
jgi:hypothetical protein